MHHTPRQTRRTQVLVAVLGTTMAAVACVGATGTAGAVGAPATRESVVPSTTVAIVATPAHVTVAPEAPIRIGPAQPAGELDVFLDGTDEGVRAEIIAAIDGARSDMSAADETAGTDTTTDAAAAAGSTAPEESDDGDRPVDRRETTAFLVANVGAGCFPAETITVVRPGPSSRPRDVMVAATFPDDEVDCVAALHSIAVVAVDVADVPVGGADQADLAVFVQVDRGGSVDVLARVRLIPPLPGHTQLAIEFAGCRARSAELVITSDAIRAIGNQGDDSYNPLCAAPEYFLGVFELPNWAIPEGAEIRGLVTTFSAPPAGVLPADGIVATSVLPGDEAPAVDSPAG